MNISQAKEIVKAIVEHNIEAKADGASTGTLMTPQLISDPGLGKSSVVEQVASELELDFRVVMLASYDSGELGGMPFLNEKDGQKEYARARPDFLSSEGKGILFLDAMSQAPMANLNIAAQLVNDHKIGEHLLGEGWTIVVANNRMSNRAGTNQIPTHLRDRLMPIEVDASLDDAINYFNTVQANPKLTSFLRVFPQRLAEFDVARDACPSPRSWLRVNTLLGMQEKGSMTNSALNHCITSTVGAGAANDFVTHLELHEKMIDPADVIANPEGADLPEDVNVSYILCAALASRANESNIGKILKYSDRLKYQDQIAFLVKDALMRTGAKESPLLKTKELKKWLQVSGKELVL